MSRQDEEHPESPKGSAPTQPEPDGDESESEVRGNGKRLSRRKFLALALAGGMVTAGGGLGYATYVEPEWVRLVKIEIPIAGLPESFDGLRLIQLSDMHSGTLVNPDYIDYCFKLAASRQPDLVLLTGDYVTGLASYVRPVAASIETHLNGYTKIAVLGNHDYWAGPVAVRDALVAAGVRVLGNEPHKIVRGKEFFWIIGTHDYWSGLFDDREALDGVSPSDPKIVLSHNPDTLDYFRNAGVDLMLSGHTHGGQVNLPFIGPLLVPSKYGAKYAFGLFEFGRFRLYVNRGIGVISPPVRFRMRPEITQITLRSVGRQSSRPGA